MRRELSQERWRQSTNFSFPWLWPNDNSICFPSQSSIFYFLLKHKKLGWWGFSPKCLVSAWVRSFCIRMRNGLNVQRKHCSCNSQVSLASSCSCPPLSMRNRFQTLQCLTEGAPSAKPYIYYVFLPHRNSYDKF